VGYVVKANSAHATAVRVFHVPFPTSMASAQWP